MVRRITGGALAGLLVAMLAGCGSSGTIPRAPTTTTSAPTTSAPPSSTSTSTSTSTVNPTTTTSPGSTSTSGTSVPVPLLPLGAVTTRMPTAAHVVALTFDAGANADGLPSILATLKAAGVRATFFPTGHFVEAYPGLSLEVARAGFVIGDHSMTHPHFPQLSDAQVDAEVLDAARSIAATTGRGPAPLFRFPYGDSDDRTIADVNRLGYAAVGWTVDTLGWEGTSAGVTVDQVVARVVGALAPGEIVLMHVGSNPADRSTLDADALPRVIAAVEAAGYSFVALV